MACDSSCFAGAVLVALVCSSRVLAGPVTANEVPAQAAVGEVDTKQLAAPGLAAEGDAAGRSVATGTLGASKQLNVEASAQNPSSSGALAAEILREAQAEATGGASDEPRPTGRRPNALAAKPAKPENATAAAAAQDDWGLRKLGRAAVHWIQESVPWFRGRPGDGGEAPSPVGWSDASLSGSPDAQGQQDRNPNSTVIADAPASRHSEPPSGASYQGAAQHEARDSGHNLIREAVKAVQEVLGHPMTWLVISLVVVGSVLVSVVDRRPK
jgi:hypothetical protein